MKTLSEQPLEAIPFDGISNFFAYRKPDAEALLPIWCPVQNKVGTGD